MPRKLDNWLNKYIDFTENTESAPIFHKWTGLSILSCALRKQVWLSLGRIKVYPNLYIVLVAEPGIARKSQAINFGLDLMHEVELPMSADCITKEALLQDLEGATGEYTIAGETIKYCCLNIISKEFESFLGQKRENTKMLVLLTDLYDAPEMQWSYRTKQSGTNILTNVMLNVLGATTPESLASSLPSQAIGGGLTSRMIFIWAEGPGKKVAYPGWTKELLQLREDLIRDLAVISRMAGNYTFDKEVKAQWKKWYDAYDERGHLRICKDPSFHGWYSRKPMFILKIAMLLTTSAGMQFQIPWENIERAEEILIEAEWLMGRTFSAVGRSDVTPDVDLVKNIISQHGTIEERALLQMVWRDIDSRKFDNVISTAIRSGHVRRNYLGPQGETGIWYSWTKTKR